MATWVPVYGNIDADKLFAETLDDDGRHFENGQCNNHRTSPITMSAASLNSVKDHFAFRGKHTFIGYPKNRNPLNDRD